VGLKVAVVGLSDSWRQAPWDERGWELWGLPWHEGQWPHMHRLFEMHDLRLLRSEHCKRPEGYMERLRECQPYMQHDSEYGKRYPFEEVAKTTGYYWNSSIAYALAMAIHEGAEEIGLWGVDMKADDEYGYQRPNVEFLIGLAIGSGIKVHIPETSPLLKFNPKGPKFFDFVPEYVDRYGWLGWH
jgi:hypothetical protein